MPLLKNPEKVRDLLRQRGAKRKFRPEGVNAVIVAALPLPCRSCIRCAPSRPELKSSADFPATWRSGYAAVCKTVYAGSIPAVASNFPFITRLGPGRRDSSNARRRSRDARRFRPTRCHRRPGPNSLARPAGNVTPASLQTLGSQSTPATTESLSIVPAGNLPGQRTIPGTRPAISGLCGEFLQSLNTFDIGRSRRRTH